MKRMLCALTVFCLLLAMVPMPAWAETVTQANAVLPDPQPLQPIGKGYIEPRVNPLYDDILDLEDIKPRSDRPEAVKPQMQDEALYGDETQLALAIRENMRQRNEYFTIYLKTSSSDLNTVFWNSFDTALEHTGVPTEGDYLAWHWGWLNPGVGSHQFYQGYHYVELNIEMMFYTNAEQEAELDRAVEDLLDRLDLDGRTDYEKLCGVYDYITRNIVYDYEHLEDSDYYLMYTAYAALVDQTAVCQGYANLLYRLLLALDVDNRIVVGDAGGPHAWNIVKMGSQYYYADSTWDASYAQAGYSYQYFLLGSNNFTRDHTPDSGESPCVLTYPISAMDYVPGQPGQEPEPESWPKTGSCGNNLTWTLTEEGLLTISGAGEMWDYPNEEPGWYAYAAQVRECVIEEGVTSIGGWAFWDCWALERITIAEGLTRIGLGAFSYCQVLREVTLPVSLTTIDEGAFHDCYSLSDVYYAGSAAQWSQIFIDERNEKLLNANIHYGAEDDTEPGVAPVLLKLVSPPTATSYAVGEDVDLSGIQVEAFYEDGSSVLLGDILLTLESADTSTIGVHTAVVSFMGLTVEFPIYVHASRMTVALDPSLWPESSHDYGNDMDDSQYLIYNGADSLTLTFSDDTYLEYGYDFIYVYDGNDNEIDRFTGGEAAGVTVTVPGSVARIRLTSDQSYTGYGYALSAVTANTFEHVGEAMDGKEPDCVTDGAIGGIICDICGKLCGGERIPALGHDWGEWKRDDDSNDLYRLCGRCGAYDWQYANTFTDAGDSEYGDLSLAEIRALYDAVDWDMEAEYAVRPNTAVPYAPGRLTDAALDNLVAQTNFIRRLAGLDNVGWAEDLVEFAQAASLVNAVNDELTHYPTQPADMADDLYQMGYTGASSSNLAWGTHMGMMDSVLGYLDDSDSSNIDRVGHRRWLLNPTMALTGFGVTSAGSYSHYHAMYAFDQSNSDTDADFVAYPGGNGIYPSEFFAPHVAWSVQLSRSTFHNPDANEVTVTLTRESDGKQWEFHAGSEEGYFNVENSYYGSGCAVIFRPNDVGAYEGAYHVLITGLQTRDGEIAAIEYTVDFRSLSDAEEPEEPEDPTDPEEPVEPDFEPTCGTTDAQIYEILIGLKDQYPEGMPWTNDNSYRWNINNTIGYGCAAFSFILSDAAFGYLPSRTIYDDITIDDLRVGDILRMYNDSHSAVVLEVYDDYVVLAEGNYNDSVHWGRIYTAAEVAADTTYVVTRYPAHSFENGVCTECGAEDPDYAPDPVTEYGDVSGDGRINTLDLIILRQFLAGWDVSADIAAADVNANGSVNTLDLIILRQYLAGWDVTLGSNS